MVSDALARVLEDGRSRFNALFSEARYLYPELDGEAFGDFLTATVDSVLQTVAEVQPEAVATVTQAAYEAGLELVGQRLVGPAAPNRHIETGWQRLLPPARLHLCTSPERMIAALSNALHNLSSTQGARPELWIAELERLTPRCPDVDTWLRVGQVVAWRAGLAHFRESALAVADGLPEELAVDALGAPAAADWQSVRERVLDDPWFDPGKIDAEPSAGLRRAARVGSFRGFGGLFPEPPLVTVRGGSFVVSSAGERWTLFAGCFGATWQRAAETTEAVARLDAGADISLQGTAVHHRSAVVDLAELGELTSVARTAHTLAVTGRFSHAVVLLALQ